jgi:uncharacterized protein YjgD (DUF1641 family)
MTTATNTESLRGTIQRALDELAEDASRYLELLEALRQADPSSEVYEDLEVEVEVQVGVMQAHTTSLTELIDELNDALAESA